MKFFVVINSLDSGGAEKSSLKLCEGLLSDGHQVQLVTFTSSLDFYPTSTQMRRANLDSRLNLLRSRIPFRIGVRAALYWLEKFRKAQRLRGLVKRERPDCIIAMSARVATFVFFATRFLGIATIGSERIHPDSKIFSHGWFTDWLRPYIYRHGMVLSVQSASVARWCKEEWSLESFVTPNHLSRIPQTPEFQIRNNSKEVFFNVLSIGRDHPQKNFDFLLSSWKIVEKAMKGVQLSIMGPNDTTRLQQIAIDLGLQNVKILPRRVEVENEYCAADLFVSTSLFEGFPNVVLEAMSYGLPVVSTPSCDVVEDFAEIGACVIADSSNPENFAKDLVRVMQDLVLRSKMTKNAVYLSRQYTWESIRENWYQAIEAARMSVE